MSDKGTTKCWHGDVLGPSRFAKQKLRSFYAHEKELVREGMKEAPVRDDAISLCRLRDELKKAVGA
jgi:hypothetical protein